MTELNNDSWQDPDLPLPLTSPLSHSSKLVSSMRPLITNMHQLFTSVEYNDCITNQQPEPISFILHNNPRLYHEILDIMLCTPDEQLSNHLKQHFSEKQIENMPYKCFDLLNSLNEEEGKYLLTVEDKTEQDIAKVNMIVKHYYSVFKEADINETAAGYVLRINETVFMRESSFPLYEWLNNHEDVLGNILQHFDSCSATGIIVRLLDLDVENVTVEERTKMIERIIEKVIDLSVLLNKPKLISGLKQLFDQQFQRAMNSENAQTLTNQIVTATNISRLAELFCSSHQTTAHLLEIVISILNHYKKEQPKVQKEHSRNYMGYRPPPQIYIPTEILKLIVQVLGKTYEYVKQEENRNESGYVKRVYFRYLEVLGYVGKYYTKSAKELVSVVMVNDLIGMMHKYDKNNLLHIAVKEFVIGVVKNAEKEEIIYNPQCKLVDFIFKQFPSKQNYYQQHLFEIIHQLLADTEFQEQSTKLTLADFAPVSTLHQTFLDRLPKDQPDNDTEEQGEQSQVEDLADFDPTKNIDNLSPYYYQEMMIDEDYEKEGQRRGSYSWKDGKMIGGVLPRNIGVDAEEVDSPIIYRFGDEGELEKDKEKLWSLKISNILDSENEDSLSKKLSSKIKEIESFEEKSDLKEEMNDEKRQESLELEKSDIQQEQEQGNIPTEIKQAVQPEKNADMLVLPSLKVEILAETTEKKQVPLLLNPTVEEEESQKQEVVERTSWTQKITKKVLSPFVWIAEFVWDIS